MISLPLMLLAKQALYQFFYGFHRHLRKIKTSYLDTCACNFAYWSLDEARGMTIAGQLQHIRALPRKADVLQISKLSNKGLIVPFS